MRERLYYWDNDEKISLFDVRSSGVRSKITVFGVTLDDAITYYDYQPKNKRVVVCRHPNASQLLGAHQIVLLKIYAQVDCMLEEVQAQQVDQAEDEKTFSSCFDRQYRLEALQFLKNALDKLDAQDIELALADRWNQIKDSDSDKMSLSYMALSHNNLTPIFCELANCLALQLNKPAINILMPSIATESQYSEFPDLTKVDLLEVIRTHIVEKNGQYLIPISMLAKRSDDVEMVSDYPALSLTEIDTEKLVSPYYQYDIHTGPAYLDESTVYRLFSYSKETSAILDAVKRYQHLKDGEDHLLGQLTKLTDALRTGSTRSGLGEEEEADTVAYVGIKHFFTYYKDLPDDCRDHIPVTVKSIIDELHTYVTEPTRDDQGQIIDRSTEISTCVATISGNLANVLAPEPVQLALEKITISKAQKENILEGIIYQYEEARMLLQKQLLSKELVGKDHFPLSFDVLQALSLVNHYRIKTKTQFEDFMQLSSDDIVLLCNEIHQTRHDIVQFFEGIEDMVMFILDNPEDKVEALFEAVSEELMDEELEIFQNVSDFASLIGPFQGDRFKSLLSIFGDTFITDATSYRNVWRMLDKGQQDIFVEYFCYSILDFVECAHDFACVLETLDDDFKREVYKLFEDQLREMVHDFNDFKRILRVVDIESRDDFFLLVKDDVFDYVGELKIFLNIYKALGDRGRQVLYEFFETMLQEIEIDAHEFALLMRGVNPLHKRAIYQLKRDNLEEMIECPFSFHSVFGALNSDQKTWLYPQVRFKVIQFINKPLDFSFVFQCLTNLQKSQMFRSIRSKLVGMINDVSDFYAVFEYLNRNQKKNLFSDLSDKLKTWSYTLADVSSIVDALEERSIQLALLELIFKNKRSDMLEDFLKFSPEVESADDELYQDISKDDAKSLFTLCEKYLINKLLDLFPKLRQDRYWQTEDQNSFSLVRLQNCILATNQAGLFNRNEGAATRKVLFETLKINRQEPLTLYIVWAKMSEYMESKAELEARKASGARRGREVGA